jgi:glyoxylase I family protein
MTTFQHMAFNCRDRRAQQAFYSKHLGFKQVRTFNKGNEGEFAMFRLGSACIEFFSAPGADPSARGGTQAIGFAHMAFEVLDIEATVASLHADGVETGEIIDCSAELEGLRVCFFADPEGNTIEVMEGYRDET